MGNLVVIPRGARRKLGWRVHRTERLNDEPDLSTRERSESGSPQTASNNGHALPAQYLAFMR
jgi:hypothetical protein